MTERNIVNKNIRPSDLITIPLRYEINNKADENGFGGKYLSLSTLLEPKQRKTLAETREIESLKGKILIKDKYGDLLQVLNDIEIECKGSLPAIGKAGLAYAIGEDERVFYTSNEYKISLYVNHKDNSSALKQAVSLNHDLSVEFIPEAIMFTGGSILK